MTLRYEQTSLALKAAQALLQTSIEDEAKVLFTINTLVNDVAKEEREHCQKEIDWLKFVVKGLCAALRKECPHANPRLWEEGLQALQGSEGKIAPDESSL